MPATRSDPLLGTPSRVPSAGHRPSVLEQADRGHELQAILEAGAIRPVFQPVVDLGRGEVVAYEALARGPSGSSLERPDLLFATARDRGRVAELDRACRAAALASAARSGLEAPTVLFVNVEPDALDLPGPGPLGERWAPAAQGRPVVLEITERALTARPAQLLRAVAAVRDLGYGLALDDIGADTRSLALMPLLAPDVLKLDLRLVQTRPTTETAAIVNAVGAHCERTGAHVVAEGIETEEHLATAVSMGATHGQGWLFGRPGPLPSPPPAPRSQLRRVAPPARSPGATPFEVVGGRLTTREATKPLLIAMSLHLENQARPLGPGAVVLSAFQTAERFTARTRERYAELAEEAALVAALGTELEAEPAPGVRGTHLLADDALQDEWSVAVIGHHFAGALVAVDLGDTGPEHTRRFRFAVTYDRDLVVQAAATLMARVAPHRTAAGPGSARY